MSNAKIGLGARLQYSSCASTVSTYTSLTELLDIDSPSPEYAMLECTNMDTTAAKDYVPQTLAEGGQLDVSLHYTTTAAAALAGALGLKRAWRIRYNGSSCHRFQGYLTTWSITAPVEDKMTCKGTIKVTTLPVYSATSTVA